MLLRRVVVDLVSAVSAAVLVTGTVPATAASHRDGAAPAAITFATYNVLRDSMDARHPWAPRRDRAAELLGRLGADVVAVQEGGGLKGEAVEAVPARDLAARLGYAYALTSSVTYHDVTTPRVTYGGQYILYRPGRFSVVRAGEIDLGKPTPRANLLRSPWAELQDLRTGRRVLVVNVHLWPGTTARADRIRARETRTLLSAVAALQPGTTPVVHLGDFNSRRTGKDAPTRVLKRAGVVDSLALAKRATNAELNTFNGLKRKAAAHGHHLDHVWVPTGTRVRTWVQAADVRTGRYVGAPASDHNPVAARVVLPG